jgi:RHS repeat-associated protein
MGRFTACAAIVLMTVAVPAQSANEVSAIRSSARVAAAVDLAPPISSFPDSGRYASQFAARSPSRGLGVSLVPLFTGANVQSVPLELPQMEGVLLPALELQYSSETGATALGSGWHLPIGQIAIDGRFTTEWRTGARAVIQAPNFSAELVFDGTTFKEYATSYQLRIKQLVSQTKTPCWQVESPDGTRMRFGCTTRSQVVGEDGSVKSWALDSNLDHLGRGYVVEYSNDSHEVLPLAIRPVQPHGNENPISVGLSYKKRVDVQEDYALGALRRQTMLLDRLTISVGNRNALFYQFTYQSDETGQSLTQLSKVERVDGSAREAILTASYSALAKPSEPKASEDGPDWYVRPNSSYPWRWYAADMCLPLDLDGDGKTDFICYAGNGTEWRAVFAKDGAWVSKTWPNGPNGVREILDRNEPPYYIWRLGSQCVGGDFNGDGRGDVACYSRSGAAWQVGLSTGDGWKTETWTGGPNPPPTWKPNRDQRVAIALRDQCLAGDFDGDGKTDVACALTADGTWHVWHSTGSGWRGLAVPGGIPVPQYASGADLARTCTTGDFDGDGRTDIACRPYVTSGRYESTLYVALSRTTSWKLIVSDQGPTADHNLLNWGCIVADLNGDGRADIACSRRNGQWRVGYVSDDRIIVRDYGGLPSPQYLGRECLVSNSPGSRKARLLCHAGASDWQARHVHDGEIRAGDSFKGPSLPRTQEVGGRCLTGDFNGDGVADFMCSTSADVNSRQWSVVVSSGYRPLLTQLKRWPATLENFEYGTAASQQRTQVPGYLAVLLKWKTFASEEKALVRSFNYSGGYYNAATHNFRGFAEAVVEEHDEATGLKRTGKFSFHQSNGLNPEADDPKKHDYSSLGRLYGSELRDHGGDKVLEENIAYGRYGSSIAPEPIKISRRHCDRLAGCFLTVHEELSYDAVGNITERKISTSSSDDQRRLTERAVFKIDTDRWLLRLPLLRETFGDHDELLEKTELRYEVDQCQRLALPSGPTGGLPTEVLQAVTGSGEQVRSTKFCYDLSGRLLARVGADGSTRKYKYRNTVGGATEITDEYGLRTSIVRSDGGTASDPAIPDLVQIIRDPAGRETRFEYGSFGRLTKRLESNGNSTSFSLEATQSGLSSIATGADGLAQTSVLDRSGRAIERRSSSVMRSVFSRLELDGAGRPLRADLPSESSSGVPLAVRYTYDSLGRLTSQVQDRIVPLLHCRAGLRLILVRPGRVAQAVQFDSLGFPVSVAHSDGPINECAAALSESTRYQVRQTYKYDVRGRLLSSADASNHRVQKRYLLTGELAEVHSSLWGSLVYTYTKLGSLAKVRTRGCDVLEIRYELGERPREVVERDEACNEKRHSVLQFGTEGSSAGRLSRISEGDEWLSLEYEPSGATKAVRRYLGGELFELTYSYDHLGRTRSITYPRGEALEYRYTGPDLTEVLGNGRSYVRFEGIGPDGRATRTRVLNHVTIATDRAYGEGDACRAPYGRECSSSMFAEDSRSRNRLLGRITQTLNEHGQVETETSVFGRQEFRYDAIGRLVSHKRNELSTDVYRYSPAGDVVSSPGTGSVEYGKNTNGTGLLLTGTIEGKYRYDTNGRVTEAPGLRLSYDSIGRVSEMRRGLKVRSISYGLGGEVSERRFLIGKELTPFPGYVCSYWPRDCRLTVRGATGPLVTRTSYEGIEVALLTDERGSTRAFKSLDGRHGSIEYTPFGEPTMRFDVGWLERSKGIEVQAVYSGLSYDAGTRTYSTKYRTYDPRIGRFLQPDLLSGEVEWAGMANPYGFAGGDPINMTDRFGLYGQMSYSYGSGDGYGWGYSAYRGSFSAPYGFSFFALSVKVSLTITATLGNRLDFSPDFAESGSSLMPALPRLPQGISVGANAATLSALSGNPDLQLSRFIKLVAPGGDWDYKGHSSKYPGFSSSQLADIGNINYGFVASQLDANFTDDEILRAAGWVQMATSSIRSISHALSSEFGRPSGYTPSFGVPWRNSPPFGDDWRDHQMIRLGIELSRNPSLLRLLEGPPPVDSDR